MNAFIATNFHCSDIERCFRLVCVNVLLAIGALREDALV